MRDLRNQGGRVLDRVLDGPHIHILMHLPADQWATLRDKLTKCLVTSMIMSSEEFMVEKLRKSALPPSKQKSAWLPV